MPGGDHLTTSNTYPPVISRFDSMRPEHFGSESVGLFLAGAGGQGSSLCGNSKKREVPSVGSPAGNGRAPGTADGAAGSSPAGLGACRVSGEHRLRHAARAA